MEEKPGLDHGCFVHFHAMRHCPSLHTILYPQFKQDLPLYKPVCESLPSITQNVPPMIHRRQLLVLSLYLDLLSFRAFQVIQLFCSSVLHRTVGLRSPELLNLLFHLLVNSGSQLRPVAQLEQDLHPYKEWGQDKSLNQIV